MRPTPTVTNTGDGQALGVGRHDAGVAVHLSNSRTAQVDTLSVQDPSQRQIAQEVALLVLAVVSGNGRASGGSCASCASRCLWAKDSVPSCSANSADNPGSGRRTWFRASEPISRRTVVGGQRKTWAGSLSGLGDGHRGRAKTDWGPDSGVGGRKTWEKERESEKRLTGMTG